MTDKVQWPGKAVSSGDDLAEPVHSFLVDVHLLAEDDEKNHVRPLAGTPYSLQVITSGATALNKAWASAIAGGGLLAALGSAWGAVNSQDPSVKAALAVSLGFVIAAAAVAIALIVSSDVRARAAATVAQYSARARVVDSFLGTTSSAQENATSSASMTSIPTAIEPTTRELLVAMSAASGSLRIVTLEGEQTVTAVRTSADGSLELQGTGGWFPLAEVKGFELRRRD